MPVIGVQGIDDFKRAMYEFNDDLKKRVIKSALRAASKPIIRQAQSIAKVLQRPTKRRLPGVMRDRVRAVASKKHSIAKDGSIGMYIKPVTAKNAKKTPLDPFYYRFVAGGYHAVGSRRVAGGKLTRALNLRKQAEAGKIRFIAGDNFLGKAFQAQGGAALREFENTMKRRIDLANRRK